MDRLKSHLAVAVRKLVRAPLFAVTAVVTLAVGIGANTAIFSVVNGVLLKPLPFRDSDELVGLWFTAPGLNFDQVPQSPATYLTIREDSQRLEDMALWSSRTAQITGQAEPEQVESLMVTDGLLPILGIDAAVGRRFSAADDAPDAPNTVMLSHAYWERAFGGSPDAVGRTLQVDGRPWEIIGVLPEDFRFLDRDPAFLFPARFNPAEVFMGNFSYLGIARMKPGVTPDQVAAEMERLAPVAAERYPGPVSLSMLEQARFAPIVHPLKDDLVGDVRPVLWVLLGTVAMVLLIACANVANLFLVRAESNQRDVAVRTALGAGRGDIAGQFLTESVLLGIVGGVGGVALAWLGLKLLLSRAPAGLPRIDQITLGPLVLGFTLVISVLAGLLFGGFALMRYGRPNMVTSLKEGGRGSAQGKERHRARNTLVVAQMALALVLLVGSGLMIRSFQALRGVDPGFDSADLFTFRVSVPEAVIPDQGETVAAFEQMFRNLEAIPGVDAVGSAVAIPMDEYESNDAVYVEDHPTPEGEIPPLRRFDWVMPGFFAAMDIPVVAGRDLTWDDVREGRHQVVVSENFAREYWGEPRAAIGKRVSTISINNQEPIWQEIVGVVGNVHLDGLDSDPETVMYWPMFQSDLYGEGPQLRRTMVFALRAQPGVVSTLLPASREAIRQVTASVPLAQVRTQAELVRRSMARTSFTLVMLGIAALVALLLGSVGIYGVISYAVSQRTREIGVRMALGAERGSVARMVVGQGMVLVAAGVGIGLLAAFGLTRLMASLLYGVRPVDLPTYAVVSAALAGVAVVASWLPARRAARVDPAVTLREE